MRYLIEGRLQKTLHVWFGSSRVTDAKNVDIIRYHAVDRAFKWSDATNKQKSLITHLDDSEEGIFANFANNTRNEIRRATRDGVITRMYCSKELATSQGVLDDFACMYNEMYREKNMPTRIAVTELLPIIRCGGLIITSAEYEGSVLVYHVYISEKGNARLLYSCSNFRVSDESIKKLIGRANRLLHWDDMRFLKKRGVSVYDWGGVASFEEPNGIDKFKFSFNGDRVEYYNLAEYVSIKAKLLRQLGK